ncbi:MAG: sulfur oxidation c-type cytochrome SoxX [Gammaproteobacteria bacterium]|nr:sulfur oxidation c-type cytochrome SoxX [Gammaproteobacteria bacterium]
MLFALGMSAAPAVIAQDAALAAEGKKVAFDRRKGNCLACHMMGDGNLAGNIGPPLIAMQARFPDKAALRAQIHDPRVRNPQTIMPPFGPHEIISESDIDKITEYVWTL